MVNVNVNQKALEHRAAGEHALEVVVGEGHVMEDELFQLPKDERTGRVLGEAAEDEGGGPDGRREADHGQRQRILVSVAVADLDLLEVAEGGGREPAAERILDVVVADVEVVVAKGEAADGALVLG